MYPRLFFLGLLSSIVSLSVGAESCKVEKHAKLPSLNNITYHQARKALLSAGWQPVQTKPNSPDDSDLFGYEKDFWKLGYVEIDACSSTGNSFCSFFFKDVYGNKLQVVTAGEEEPKQKSFAMVSNWSFVCELDKQQTQKNESISLAAKNFDFSGWWGLNSDGCFDEDNQNRVALGRWTRQADTIKFGIGEEKIGFYDGTCNLSKRVVRNNIVSYFAVCEIEGEQEKGTAKIVVENDFTVRVFMPNLSSEGMLLVRCGSR